MPSRIDIDQFLSPMPAPRPMEGMQRIAQTNLAMRQDDRLRDNAAMDAQLQREQMAGVNQRAGAELQFQRDQANQRQMAEERKADDKAMADYYDAVHQGDPVATQAAIERLRSRGFDADAPTYMGAAQEHAPTAGGTGGAPPVAPPAGKGDAGLMGELNSMESGILSSLSGEKAPPRRGPSAAELMLSPGDALLQQAQAAGAQPPLSSTPSTAAPAAPPPRPSSAELQLSPGDRLLASPGAFQAPPKPRGLQIRKGGRVISEVDPQQIQQTRVLALQDMFKPLMTGDPVQVAAAQKALQHATSLLGSVPLKDAIDAGMKLYQFEVGQAGKTKRAQIAKGTAPDFGGTGMSKAEFAVTGDQRDLVVQRIDKKRAEYGFNKLSEFEKTIQQISAAANANNGLGDLQAITGMVKIFQDRISDADMRQALAAGGLEGQARNLLGYLAQGGQKSPEYMLNLRKLANDMVGSMAAIRKRAAEELRQEVTDLGAISNWGPEETERNANVAYNTMLGSLGGRRPVQGRRAPDGGTGGEQKPAAPAPKAAPAPTRTPEQKRQRARELLGGGM